MLNNRQSESCAIETQAETNEHDPAGIYSHRFRAFKAIYYSPKVRNLTQLQVSTANPEVPP